MHENKLGILILSQQALFREGVKHLLEQDSDVEICCSSSFTDDVLSNIDTLLPDVALIDLDGASESLLNMTSRMKQRSPSIGVIMLTSNPQDTQVFQALKAQAAAYLAKEITGEQLKNVIRAVANGEHPINESLVTRPKVAEQVLQKFQELCLQSETEAIISPLTPRETEILDYIARGYFNKQIAIELGISEQTIKNHVTSILRKLNANARTEAVVVAIKQGLITIS